MAPWLTCLAALFAASLATAPAQAQTWLGTASTDWNTTGNWSPATVPTNTATFGTSNRTAITFTPANTSIQTIQINTGSSNYSFTLSSAQTLTLGSGIVDNSSGVVSFSGGLSTGGIIGAGGITLAPTNGGGTLILNGIDTFTGATIVSGATLEVDGSITSTVTVGSGGTLRGTGTVGGGTTISNAALMPGTPGNPTGSFTVNGGLVLSSVANYMAYFNGANSNTTNVTGLATLSGTFTAVAAPGSAGSYSAADTYTVIRAAGGLSGTFPRLSVSGSFGNFVPYLLYSPSSANNAVVMGLTAGTTWLGTSPTSGSGVLWSTNANWAGGTVPTSTGVTNEPATTVATFGGTAGTTLVTVNSTASAGTLLFTSGAASPFTFAVNGGAIFAISGIGIDNNSAYAPIFDVGSSTAGNASLQFGNGATAGNAVITNTSGSNIVFGTAGTLDTASAGTATITNNAGATTSFYDAATAASATITNAGTMNFYGTSTAGSATIITASGGTTLFYGNSTGGSAILNTNAGGVVDFSNGLGVLSNGNSTNAVSVGAIEGAGEILLGANTLTITNGGTSFAGVITTGGNGGIDIAGGTTTLSGTNTYLGTTTIGSATGTATLALTSTGSIKTSSGVIVNLGGTLSGTGTTSGVTVNAGGTLAPGTSGAGTLSINGKLVLNTAADYAASISSTNGTNSATAVTGSSNTATLGGTFTAVAGSGTYSVGNLYTVLTTAAATGVTGTFSGLTVTGNFGNVVPYLIYGANEVQVELTAGNIWNGGTTSWNTPGNWLLGVPTAALNSPASTATFNGAGGTVTVDTAATAANMLFTSAATAAYTFGISGTGNSLTLNGIGVVDNSGHAPIFAVGSSGVLDFTNAATAGDAIVNTASGGTTTFTGSAGKSKSNGGTAQFNIASGGVVDFSGTVGPSGNGQITAGSINDLSGTGGFVYLGSNTLTLSNGSNGGTFAGVISDCGTTGSLCAGNANGTTGGSLVIAGGTLALSGTNTYTGSTTIDAGTLALSISGSVAASSKIAIATGATFDISATTSGASITTLADSATGQAGTVALGSKTLTITAGSSTFSGSITGSGSSGLVISGGDQTLAGVSNSFTGATTINGGTLTLAAANALANSGVTITGGTLGLGSYAQHFASIALSGGTIEGGQLTGTIISTGGTVNSVGGGALLTANSGTTTLAGNNTYSGATTANGSAILAGDAANAFSANSAVTLNSTSTLDLGSVNQTIGSLNSGSATTQVTNLSNPTGLSGTVSPVLTVDNGGSFAGVIANGTPTGVTTTTALDVAGGTLTLSGTSTYTGATTIGPSTSTGTATLALSGGSIADSSGVTVNSGGTLSGFGNVSGVTVNAGGTLAATSTTTPMSLSGNLVLNTGADTEVTVTNTTLINSAVTLTGTSTASLAGILSVNAGPAGYSANDTYNVLTTTASGGVSGTFSGLTIANGSFGNFVPYLTYPNGKSVVLDLTAGNIWLGGTSTWNTTGNWTSSIVPSATASNVVNTVATFGTTGNPSVNINNTTATANALLFTTGAQAYTFTINGGGSLVLSGVGIDDNSGIPANAPKFTVGGSGSGTLEFQNAATAGDAAITTNTGGRTEFLGNSNGGTAQFILGAGGVLDFSGSLGVANNGINSAASISGVAGSSIVLGSTTLVVNPSGPNTFAGVISDCTGGCNGNANGSAGGSLVMNGSGTLTLSGANTYTGGTTLSAGTLNVGVNSVYTTAGVPSSGIVSSAIGTGTLLFNGGTLQAGDTNFSTDHTGFSIANAGQITSVGGTIDANGQIFTLAGAISDNATSKGGTLTVLDSTAGNGTVVFSGANTYSGNTIIGGNGNAVTLKGGAANVFSPSSAVTLNTAATLDLGGFNQTIASLTGTAGTVTNSGTSSPAVLILDGGTATAFSGTIQDGTSTTGLTLTGSGTTLTLSAANTYTGATSIGSGTTLVLGAANAISTLTAVTNNGTLDLGDHSVTLAALNGTNTAALVGNFSGSTGTVLTVTGGGSYAGVIENGTASTALNLTTGGTLVLSGANTYSGGTTLNTGATVQVGNNSALGSNSLTFNGGTLQAGATGLVLTNAISVVGLGTIDANGNTLTLSGAISDNGSGIDLIIKDTSAAGGGSIILSNTSTIYSDATTVDSGTLVVTGNISSSSGVAVNGGTLAGAGNGTTTGIVPSVTVNNGGTLSPGTTSNPIGTLTINGTLTMASGANYVATISGANNSETTVSGIATLGGTITIAGTASGTSYTLLTAAGLGGSTFSSVNITGSFGNSLPSLVYTSTAVDMNFIAGNVWQGTTSAGGTVWSTGTNWTSGSPPTGISTPSTSVAAFDNTAKTTSVTASSSVTVGTMLFNANAPAFTFTINATTGVLTLNGDGIVNQSTTTTPTLNVAGILNFENTATAGNAIINTSSGGLTEFFNTSTGGSAQFATLSGGVVDFSGSTGPAGVGSNMLSAGSISGAGNYYLGSNQLTVGSNNLSTTVSGVISDCGVGSVCVGNDTGGSLNKVGTGTLTLSGTNTYTGGTTITAGTLQAMNSHAVGGGAVTLSGGTFQAGANNLTFSNIFNLNTAGGTIDTQGNKLTLSNAIGNGNGTTGTLTVASSTGSGTLDLTGANTYTGPTVVSSGTLLVDNSLASSSVTVNAGGILGGIGTIDNGVNIGVLSTLAPGPSPTGTLTINGSLTLQSASLYMVTISGTNNSVASVGGTATLNNAGLVASNTSTGVVVGHTYTVLTSGHAISGNLSSPVFNVQGIGLLQATDVTNTGAGNSITAQFQHAQLSAGNVSPGFASFINAINAASAGNALPASFANLFNLPASQQQTAVQQLSGQSNTGGATSANVMQTSFATTLLNPGLDGRASAFGGFGPVLGYAPQVPLTAEQQDAYDAVTPHDAADAVVRSMNPEYNHSVWASAYGGYSHLSGSSSDLGTATATTGGGGIASGIDFRFGPDTVMGFALGGGGTSWNVSQGIGGGNSEIFQGGIYGSHRFGDAYISGALAFAYDWMHTNRTDTAAGVANLTASFTAPGATGRIEGGYNFDFKQFQITPYIAGEFSALRTPAYTESGNPAFALAYAAATQTNERAEVGVWAGKALPLANSATLWLRGRVGYAHDWWSSDNFTSNFADLPTQSFTITGIAPPANVGLASLMAEVKYPSGVSLSGRFDVELASNYYSVAGTGTFRYGW